MIDFDIHFHAPTSLTASAGKYAAMTEKAVEQILRDDLKNGFFGSFPAQEDDLLVVSRRRSEYRKLIYCKLRVARLRLSRNVAYPERSPRNGFLVANLTSLD